MIRNVDMVVKQFLESKPMPKCSLKDVEYSRDFMNFILERRKLGEIYTSVLSSMGVNYDTSSCAEIGKGRLDSVVLDYDTTIITPYYSGIEKSGYKGFLIPTNIKIYDGIPKLIDNSGQLVISPVDIETYMIQNPYCEEQLDGLVELYKNGHAGIVVGVFGNIHDLDYTKKVNMIKTAQLKIGKCNALWGETDDSYYYAVSVPKKYVYKK